MKVLLSHAHTDTPLASRVSEALREKGLEVRDPELDLLPGDNWAAVVARALEESQAMVVLLTPDAVGSAHVRREMEYALGAKRYSNRLIPVAIRDRTRLPTSEIPWIVRRVPCLHLDDRRGGEAQFDLIASAVRGHA